MYAIYGECSCPPTAPCFQNVFTASGSARLVFPLSVAPAEHNASSDQLSSSVVVSSYWVACLSSSPGDIASSLVLRDHEVMVDRETFDAC